MIRRLIAVLRSHLVGYIEFARVRAWQAVHQPRMTVLERAHHGYIGALPLAVVGAASVLGSPIGAPWSVAALVYGGVSLGADMVGMVVHGLWSRGRIWPGVECPCCGPQDDGGGWWETEPDLPDDPEDHGLTVDWDAELRSLTSLPRG